MSVNLCEVVVVVLLWYIYKLVVSRYSNYTKKMIIVPKFSLNLYNKQEYTTVKKKTNERESDVLSV